MTLKIEHIDFAYPGEKVLLEDIHFTVEKGQIIGLKGASGTGKSTLASLIGGLQKATKGAVYYQGQDVFTIKGLKPVQIIYQHPEKTVNPKWRIDKILNEGYQVPKQVRQNLGIDDNWFCKWPHEISGGELQRVCIARALHPQVDYIIADEITTMLDPISQAQIINYLMDLVTSKRIGLIFISHDHALLDFLTDKVIELPANKKIS